MNVPVLWYASEKMSYSCSYMLNEMLIGANAEHHIGFGIDSHETLPKLEGAMVVFHGGNEAAIHRGAALAAIMSAETMHYKWVIFVSLGDESDAFPLHLIAHHNFRIWAQTVKPGSANSKVVNRFLIEGYHPDTRPILASLPPHERDLRWFWAGQDTHQRRHDCVAALESSRKVVEEDSRGRPRSGDKPRFDFDSVLIKTKSFGAGLTHETYYELMRRARIVPCPSGPSTPDSFRFAEALESGCVPVIDACALDGIEGYWDMVMPGHPFYVVRDWAELPGIMDRIDANWDAESQACQLYWNSYKRSFKQWIFKDLISLGAI